MLKGPVIQVANEVETACTNTDYNSKTESVHNVHEKAFVEKQMKGSPIFNSIINYMDAVDVFF